MEQEVGELTPSLRSALLEMSMKHPNPRALAGLIVWLLGMLVFLFVSLLTTILGWDFWLPFSVALLTFGLFCAVKVLPQSFFESLSETDRDR